MTSYTKGDRTMTNHDRLNEFEDDDERLNCICIYNDKMCIRDRGNYNYTKV